MSSMSTNIDDIPDPILVQNKDELQANSLQEVHHISSNDIKHVDLQQKEINSNIHSIISTDQKQVSEVDKRGVMSNVMSESNILVFFVILIASLPQTSELVTKFLPLRFHNSIIVNIIKAILLFVIYILFIKYIL